MTRTWGPAITVELVCKAHGLPAPVREFRFHPARRWRFDYAWPSIFVAAEREGGVWVAGRHTRGKGFEADCEKYNEANLLGWTVFRFTPKMIESGAAADVLKRALGDGLWPGK